MDSAAVTPALILCADDEESLLTDICDELREAGYNVLGATDGNTLMEQVSSVTPNLILCDINMPGLNGYDVLDTIREQRPDLADIPFIFLTALSNPDEIVTGKRLGADDYLVKPIDFDLLLATIDARLRQVQRMHEKASLEKEKLCETMQELTHQAVTSTSRALDLVAPGIVLLNDQGRVMYANRSATLLADTNRYLNLGETLTTTLTRENRQLCQSITDMINAENEQVLCLSLPHSRKGHDLLVLVCSLDKRNAGPAAVVLLSDPDNRVHVPPQVVAKLFNFTPTEARIALALADGRRTEEIAVDLSISATTVAFHLRNLFQKTDTNRQADLIALILAGTMMWNLGG
ncbi:response regulator [Marinobacterium marinum]|uniref:Response regulator n=1 Tax=Marinobacterium marinum TaxID=2756129 RepID=A0A7W1WX35_9GAMM|nr:response regulator [Marinobacterium marinum]MBA4501830.1 response regulator [Marinobacterium marinum]